MPNQRISFERADFLPDRIDSSVNLPPEILTDIANWRIRDGVIRRSQGFTNLRTTALTSRPTFGTNLNFADSPELLYFSAPTTGNRQFYKVTTASNNTVQTLGGNQATFNLGSAFEWESFSWGETTVLHHPRYAPIYASAGGTSNDLTNIPNWRTADETNYLIPIGTGDGTQMLGLGYHGTIPGGAALDSDRVIVTSSRITVYNQFPMWELGSNTNSASAIYPIDGLIDGDLIAGGQLQNFIVVYTDVNSLRVEPQDDGTLIIYPLFNDVGLVSRNALV